jgi:hypothetical protein
VAKKNVSANGRSHLEEAMALLIQNQASFLRDMRDMERANSERFSRIESELAAIRNVLIEHGHVLAEHGRLLERLPEAVREKIGFTGRQ